jgi:hypothetical protein
MIKNYILFAFAILLTAAVNAQCTPDGAYTEPGIYPDSATGFAPATLNQAYEQLVTNVVPADTMVFGFPIPIDSVVIDSVAGLPPGMSVACNPNGCAFLGGTTGCAIITGTSNVAGNYQIYFYLSAYAGGSTAPNPTLVDYYFIHVQDPDSGLDLIQSESFQVTPNPFNTSFELKGKVQMEVIRLYNAQGQQVWQKQLEAFQANINSEELPSGVYFLEIETASRIERIKINKAN